MILNPPTQLGQQSIGSSGRLIPKPGLAHLEPVSGEYSLLPGCGCSARRFHRRIPDRQPVPSTTALRQAN